MTDLTAFLRRAAAAPFAFGEWDCAMFLANWVREQTGRDPAAALRPRYRTRLGWMRLARREGGLVALVGRVAAAAGMTPLPETDVRAGDIGIVTLRIGETGAIATGDGRWVAKVHGGLAYGSAPSLTAWGFR